MAPFRIHSAREHGLQKYLSGASGQGSGTNFGRDAPQTRANRPNNSHFDTMRANIEYVGAQALDLLAPEGQDIYSEARFKGNVDIGKLAKLIETEGAANIPFCMITVTNNTSGGQPVSMANIKQVKALLSKHHISLVIDSCRFAENPYFVKEYEPGFSDRRLLDIARRCLLMPTPRA